MATALKAVRSDVQWLEDVDGLTAESPDEEWLELAERNGWLVVTRDRHISSRPAERATAEAFDVGLFVIREQRALNRWRLLKLSCVKSISGNIVSWSRQDLSFTNSLSAEN